MEEPVFSRVKVCLVPSFPSGPHDRTTFKQESLQREITALLSVWRNLDPTIALAPWHEEDKGRSLILGTTASVVPVHWNIAPSYFYGLNYAGTELWFHMRVRHTLPMDDLLQGNLPLTLRLFLARLQSSERPTVGGFFAHSLKEYAQSTLLRTAVQEAVSAATQRQVELALFWAPLNCRQLELRGPYVMQLEVDEKDYDDVRRVLVHLYNKKKEYPLQINMVFIPPPSRCVDQNLPFQACASHNSFLKAMRTYVFAPFKPTFNVETPIQLKPETSIGALKHVSGIAKKDPPETACDDQDSVMEEVVPAIRTMTIAQLLQAISVDGVPVFRAVLPTVVRGTKSFLLVVIPGPGGELARMVVNSPVAYFSQIIKPKNLSKVFSALAMSSSSVERFDPELLRIVNTEEADTSDALNQFLFELPPQFGNRPQPALRNSQFYDTFSLSASSIQTTGASKRTRFQQAADNLSQVPGAASATGEKK